MKSWYESKTIWLGLATIATSVVSPVIPFPIPATSWPEKSPSQSGRGIFAW